MAHNLKFKNLSLKKGFQVALSDPWLLNKSSSEGYTGGTIIVQHFSSVQFSSWFLNMNLEGEVLWLLCAWLFLLLQLAEELWLAYSRLLH